MSLEAKTPSYRKVAPYFWHNNRAAAREYALKHAIENAYAVNGADSILLVEDLPPSKETSGYPAILVLAYK